MATRLSIIVPVYNNPPHLQQCLAALVTTVTADDEVIVVDDGSTDETASVAAAMGVRMVRLPRNGGPGAARNHGVRHAGADIVLFVDADVVAAPDAVARVVRTFAEHPELSAVFGSYDASPQATSPVSQFRNLLHHYVHQHGEPAASTFWAGCGAVRRAAFEAVGGFDEGPTWRSIEDIELGYRLRRAGYRILLDKGLQGTHLKRWTLRSMLRTDTALRAVPWTRLILRTRNAPSDLNLRPGQRLSVGLVALALAVLPLAVFRPALLAVAATALLGVVALNAELYAFFHRRRGPWFALLCVPLHFLYLLCSGAGFLYAWLGVQLASPRAARRHESGCLT